MTKRIEGRLTKREDIVGNMVLIDGSSTDYITEYGSVYKIFDYDKNLYLKKKYRINKHNGYVYIGITFSDGINRNRRLHVLLAKAHINNPKPDIYNIVGHMNNVKSDFDISNLYWTNVSENTKKAFYDVLIKNDIGYEDSQSIPVYCFDINKNLIKDYGSMIRAFKDTGITVSTIGRQCRHEIKTHPRCGYYFRFQEEYNKYVFI